MSNLNGVLLIDKPKEFTSFDVIAVVRRLTGQKKLGHTGTLDPNATGVLPVLLGTATKTQDLILNHDKSYTAEFQLGKTTDTLDIWGTVTGECESSVTEEQLRRAIPEFTGEIEQIPPMYSAVQKNGQRLYDLARQGIEVERESRKVTVYSLSLANFDEKAQTGTLEISCSKGTYVRTIIDDIGRVLGVGAVMTALRRTSACGFSLDECITLDELKSICENGNVEEKLRSVESLFMSLGYLAVSSAQAKRFANGGALSADKIIQQTNDLNKLCKEYREKLTEAMNDNTRLINNNKELEKRLAVLGHEVSQLKEKLKSVEKGKEKAESEKSEPEKNSVPKEKKTSDAKNNKTEQSEDVPVNVLSNEAKKTEQELRNEKLLGYVPMTQFSLFDEDKK